MITLFYYTRLVTAYNPESLLLLGYCHATPTCCEKGVYSDVRLKRERHDSADTEGLSDRVPVSKSTSPGTAPATAAEQTC